METIREVEFDKSWIGPSGYADSVPNMGAPVKWTDEFGRTGVSIPAGEGCVTIQNVYPGDQESVIATGEARGMILRIASGLEEIKKLVQKVLVHGGVTEKEALECIYKYIEDVYPDYKVVDVDYYINIVEYQMSLLRSWGWLKE